MPDRVHYHPNLIFSLGTQVVTLVEVLNQSGKVLHPRGSVGVVVRSPADLDHPYRVRFADGTAAITLTGSAPLLPKDEQGIPTQPIVSMSGRGGGPGGWRAWAWVFPLPPEGPVQISVAFETAGLGESTISIDGKAVREAAERAKIIWT